MNPVIRFFHLFCFLHHQILLFFQVIFTWRSFFLTLPFLFSADFFLFFIFFRRKPNALAPYCISLLSVCLQRNLTEYFVAVDVNNMLQLYASMLHERRIIITSSKLSTVSPFPPSHLSRLRAVGGAAAPCQSGRKRDGGAELVEGNLLNSGPKF